MYVIKLGGGVWCVLGSVWNEWAAVWTDCGCDILAMHIFMHVQDEVEK